LSLARAMTSDRTEKRSRDVGLIENPVLRGFNADPKLCRVGGDCDTTESLTFADPVP
jgi:hypothetical protein